MVVSLPSVDEELRGLTFSSISLVAFTIGAVLVFLRMYVRVRRHIIGWDDYLICMALALSLLGTVADVYEVANGAGKHIENLLPAMRSGFLKWTLVAETELVIATCLIKLSVCVFVLRFINRTRKTLQYCIYILMAFMIVSTVGLVTALLVQCRPVAALYDPHVKGKCYSKHVLFSVAYVQGAISILTDFLCAGLPIVIIRTLQMKRSMKWGLSVLMGLGVFAASCSILRTALLFKNYSEDITYTNLVDVVFAMLERNIGIIAASIPTLRPLFTNVGQIVRVDSETAKGPYASDRPFLSGRSAPKIDRKPKTRPIVLDDMSVA